MARHSDDPHDHDHYHGGPHSHDHNHHHDHAHAVVGNIRLAFLLNFCFSLIELGGGFMIGSMAIMAGAVHDFGDSVSLGIAWGLENFSKRGRDRKFNFGYRRFSLLSALISGIVISVSSILIVFESIRRFNEARPPSGLGVVLLAIIGLGINGFAAFRLSRGSTQNEKVLTWHLVEDMMGWAIVLIGGIIMAATGIAWIDPVLAIGLSFFVLFNVFRHLKITAYLFLQGRPPNFSEENFIVEVLKIPGIEHIDHLAVWSLDGQTSVLSARLHLHSIRDPMQIENAKTGVREVAARHGASRTTLETCLAEHVPHHEES